MPSPVPADHPARMERALRSLRGLAVGDAFGQCFFCSDAAIERMLTERELPSPPWTFTDDTVMALGVLEVLGAHGRIVQDRLAVVFARRWAAEPDRGYGGTAARILRGLREGRDWRACAGEVFSGMGSMGNGGAMRAGPLGAYFADDLPALLENARASAEVTHAHPDGQAGAVAVALAAAWAWRHRAAPRADARRRMLDFVLEHTPAGETHALLARARSLPADASVTLAASALGTGLRLLSADTVPFALWCAGGCLDDFAEAIWTTVSGLGDRDTTCAIVGSVVALSAPEGAAIPEAWSRASERVSMPWLGTAS